MSRKHIPVTALLLATVFASCGSDSSSGTDSGEFLQGSWTHSSPPDVIVLHFAGSRMHRIHHVRKCLVAEDWGGFTYASSVIRYTPDSAYSRAYQSSDADSATVCLGDLGRVDVSGSTRTTLENVSSTSFVERAVKITIVNGVGTIDTVRRAYVKQ